MTTTAESTPTDQVLGTYAEQLSPAQIAHFNQHGYLICPAWIAEADLPRLRREIDIWNAGGVEDVYAPAPSSDRTARQMDFKGHWELFTHKSLMRVVGQLLGEGFAHHHLHTAKHMPGDKGVNWHHDYEQHPQTNRSHGMIHTFWYLNGLDGSIGDLLVLPGSQRMVCERSTLNRFNTDELPGSIVVNKIPPGSMVIVHSAVFHARRAKAGGGDKPRYFIDSSYCQKGVQWPSDAGWLAAHQRALDDGRAAAAGVEHLFDATHFFDQRSVDWPAFHQVNQGSLLPKLVPTKTGPA